MSVQNKYNKLSKILIDINNLTDFHLKYEILKKKGSTKATHIRFNFRYIKNSFKTAIKKVEEKLVRGEIFRAIIDEKEYQDSKDSLFEN